MIIEQNEYIIDVTERIGGSRSEWEDQLPDIKELIRTDAPVKGAVGVIDHGGRPLTYNVLDIRVRGGR